MTKIEIIIDEVQQEISLKYLKTKLIADYNNNPEIICVGLLKSFFINFMDTEKQKEAE